MKTLYLVRHAKSSWDDPLLKDFERPLKSSGVKNAGMVARHLKKNNIIPGAFLSSPALRALGTAHIFASELGFPPDRIRINEKIYESSPFEILKAVKEAGIEEDSLAVFGHDPALTGLLAYLTGERLEKIPTSAVACINLDIINWSFIEEGKGNLFALYVPKELKMMR